MLLEKIAQLSTQRCQHNQRHLQMLLLVLRSTAVAAAMLATPRHDQNHPEKGYSMQSHPFAGPLQRLKTD